MSPTRICGQDPGNVGLMICRWRHSCWTVEFDLKIFFAQKTRDHASPQHAELEKIPSKKNQHGFGHMWIISRNTSNLQSYHPCMVYLPTFSWFFMINVGIIYIYIYHTWMLWDCHVKPWDFLLVGYDIRGFFQKPHPASGWQVAKDYRLILGEWLSSSTGGKFVGRWDRWCLEIRGDLLQGEIPDPWAWYIYLHSLKLTVRWLENDPPFWMVWNPGKMGFSMGYVC